MANVIENRQLAGDFWLIRARCQGAPRMGQFYMVRAWASYPVLSRPISVFDCAEGSVSFLYKVVGKGTKLISRLGPGDEITLDGPYGNGWPVLEGKIALVGGGVGIAPMFLAAKQLGGAADIDLYLGFSDSAVLQDEYRQVCRRLTVDVGGFITDRVNPMDYDHILACGPQIMMRILYKKCADQGAGERLWVSLENRMACGMGACLVCTCKTAGGNKKVCADGPVFPAREVFEV